MKRVLFFAALVVGALFPAGVGAADITIGTGTSAWGYPLVTSYHDARIQQIYLASELGVTKQFTSLALDVSTIPGQTMNNFTIRLKHTDLSEYSSTSVWESSGWTTVYQTNLTISAVGWNTFLFTAPFVYNGTQNLMVDISFNNSSASSYGLCRSSSSSTSRALYFSTNSVYGDPLTWANRNPGPYLNYNLSNIRLGVLMATVPSVVGTAQAAAQTAITSANLTVGSVMYSFNTTVAAGNVISQSLAAGQSVTSQTAVNLVISAGVKYLGSGTAAAPYRITNKWNLLGLGGAIADYNKYFVLTADIDFEGGVFTNAIIALPATQPLPRTVFAGTFDGNGYSIKNFTIHSPSADCAGLFGYVGRGGVIKNLGIENANIQGCRYVGGLVGYNEYGAISNCYSTGSIRASTLFVSVFSTSSYAGGLVGYNAGGTLANCCSTCSVAASSSVLSSSSYVDSYAYAGGLMGSSVGAVNNCYSTGSVTSYAYSPYVSYSYAGGLAGRGSTITNCYSAGSVTASGNGQILKGGLVGSGIDIINSFWDTQTSGMAASSGGTGKTTVEMKTFSTFADAGWDFSMTDGDAADWYMPADSYPQLTSHETALVPDVVGMSQADAQTVINAAGLYVGQVKLAYSDSIPEGNVCGQLPLAGQSIPAGVAVDIFISIGLSLPGSGTAADPYQIWTAEQMYSIGLIPEVWNKQFILMADIDLSGYWGTGIKIIGNTTTQFKGTFNGNGHTISNVNILQPDSDYVGLFGIISSGGVIKNLCVVNVSVQGHSYAGGLIGYNSGTVSFCSATGINVGNASSAGGLMGLNYGTVHSCYTTGSVEGLYWVGGLVGRNSNGNITYCYSATSVISSKSLYNASAGGLVGYNDAGTIQACYAAGAVNGCDSYTGGLVGYNTNGTITSCYAMGAVNGSGADSYAGGLVGYNNTGTITSCYAVGAVSGINYFGGLVGGRSGSVINTSFWDIQTSGQTTSTGGTGKTTAEMMMLSTFTSAGWDFIGETANGTADFWFIREGQDYPRLLWEIQNDQNGLFSQGFVNISKTRIGRTMFEYELAVTIRNSNDFAMSNVQLKLMDWDAAVQSVLDDSITIDSIPAGATVTSTDTFKIVVDRSQSIVSSRLTWVLTYYGIGSQAQQAVMSMPLLAIDALPGDITGDGSVNIEDFAILAGQWNTNPGIPSADIALPLDNYVGIEDLIYLAENWLK